MCGLNGGRQQLNHQHDIQSRYHSYHRRHLLLLRRDDKQRTLRTWRKSRSRFLSGCYICTISLFLAFRRHCAAFRPTFLSAPSAAHQGRSQRRQRLEQSNFLHKASGAGFGTRFSPTSVQLPHRTSTSVATFVSVFSDLDQTMVSNMTETQSLPLPEPKANHASSSSAKIVPLSSLNECGERLRQGDLVAFPTETVYGLGCHAMDEAAIFKVFAAKERPLTDPLIVHVLSFEDSFRLWEATATLSCKSESTQLRILKALCEQFWPGPLTIVAKAAPHVPSTVMAGTGFVACRSPSHEIARALLQVARVPIAAPSANKFGHVSPTAANHVWDDLKDEDVWIVQTDDKGTNGNMIGPEGICCDIGVESTVVKVEELDTDSNQIVITMLRQGAVSATDISTCMKSIGAEDHVDVYSKTKKVERDDRATVAPGQSIRHYSPHVPSFILARSRCQKTDVLSDEDKTKLSKSVIIDFGGTLAAWQPLALAYRDLDASGDSAAAAKTVFGTLRWAEQVPDAERILFPELESDTSDNALLSALQDRLTRAASGVVLEQLN